MKKTAKQNLNVDVLSDVKVTDADIQKYVKKLSAVSKRKIVGSIIAGVALVGGGAGAATYFGIKAAQSSIKEGSGTVIIDPTVSDTASLVDRGVDTAGNQIKEVSDSNKVITGVKVTVNNQLLVENKEYKAEKLDSNAISAYKITLFKETVEKYKNSGAFKITPTYDPIVTNKYIVVFDSNGGSSVDPVQVEEGKTCPKPEDPWKDTYEFVGWYYTDQLGDYVEYNFNKPIKSNLILHAKWHIPYTSDDYITYAKVNEEDMTYGYYAYFNYDKISSRSDIPTRISIKPTYKGQKVIAVGYPIGIAWKNAEKNLIAVREASVQETIALDTMRNVDYISKGAFTDLPITEVELPETIQYIDSFSFAHCTSLSSINIPKSCTYIGYSAFVQCTSLSQIKFEEGLLNIGDTAFAACRSLKQVNLPNSLLYIGRECFAECTGLSKVKLGNSLRTINEATFIKCTALANINIPISVESIAAQAFGGTKISELVFDDPYSKWYIESHLIESFAERKEMLKNGANIYKVSAETDEYVIQYNGISEGGNLTCSISAQSSLSGEEIEIPDEITVTSESGTKTTFIVTGLSNYAFYDKADIRKLILPETIETIGANAFRDSSIEEYEFENGKGTNLYSIGESAFKNSNLKKFNANNEYDIYLPENLVNIGDQAFTHTQIEKTDENTGNIWVPASVTEMSYNKTYTSYLEKVLAKSEDGNRTEEGDDYNANPFFGCIFNSLDISKDNKYYSSDDNGLYLKGDDTIDNKDLLILAFMTDEEDGNYTISNGVLEVCANSFDNHRYYNGINKLIVPASVTSIHPYTYQLINNIEINEANKVYQYNSTEKIVYKLNEQGKKVGIEKCLDYGTKIYKVPDDIITIGYGAFADMDSLNITFNSKLETIEAYAFSYTTISNTELLIPENVKTIETYAFYTAPGTNVTLKIDSPSIANATDDYSGLLWINSNYTVYLNKDIALKTSSYIYKYYSKDPSLSEGNYDYYIYND